jgi:hypothetical protein
LGKSFVAFVKTITTSKYNFFGGLLAKASLSTMMDVVDLTNLSSVLWAQKNETFNYIHAI